jgi:peptidyl-Lys metalloendopeptidase
MKLINVVSCSALLAGTIAAAVSAQPATKANPLRVGMVAAPAASGGFLGAVEVTLTNTSNHTVRVPSWELPSQDSEAKLFKVSRDGQEVAYTGMMAKHGLPGAQDFTVLKAGETYRTTIDLSASYDLRKSGQYVITYSAPLQHASLSNGEMLKHANGLPMVAQSAPLSLWVDGSDQLAMAKGSTPSAPVQTVASLSYSRCTTSQQSQIPAAISAAQTYSENAKGYLAGGTVGARYTTWFGAYTSSRQATASQHFVNIDNALDNAAITIDCSCKKKTTYAYVYPNQPYTIYVCGAFWSAANTGTDSRAGTLIHETSHFTVVAGTDDHVYGQSGAKSLAISDPDAALDNADSHEYFAENTPFQN